MVQPQADTGITVTINGPTGPSITVSDAEATERASQYTFVLTTDPPALKTTDQWWRDDTQKRRRRERSEKLYAWLLPFVPVEIAKLEQLQALQDRGPSGLNAIAKELRALIRERRKAKQLYKDLIEALYGTCIIADFSASLEFEGIQPHYLARFVDINELLLIQLDFKTMGYQYVESLSKTDVKWLVETFGEPTAHQSFDTMWQHIRHNTVARYCWNELRSSNNAATLLGLPQKTMKEWLDELVRRNIGYFKEFQERVASREAYLTEVAAVIDAALTATRHPFIVADIETTGLDSEADEILELAALRVTPEGDISEEFSTLVCVQRQLPADVTRLTGITQDTIDFRGQPLADAIKAFTAFVGAYPIFFHNAPFDKKFILKVTSLANVKFVNPVHDTLPLARQTWPALGTYKLAALAQHIGTAVPTHRALADAKTVLAVLLAARQSVTSTNRLEDIQP